MIEIDKINGFTLIEVVVTVALAAILMTMAVPGFNGMISSNRAATQSNNLVTSLTTARSEASKRGGNVSVCSHVASAVCAGNTQCCSGSTNWATGWMVFIDQNKDGTFQDDNDATPCETDAAGLPIEDCLLRKSDALSGATTLTGTAAFVRYLPTGDVAASTTFTLTPADCRGNMKRSIDVASIGKASVTEVACP